MGLSKQIGLLLECSVLHPHPHPQLECWRSCLRGEVVFISQGLKSSRVLVMGHGLAWARICEVVIESFHPHGCPVVKTFCPFQSLDVGSKLGGVPKFTELVSGQPGF